MRNLEVLGKILNVEEKEKLQVSPTLVFSKFIILYYLKNKIIKMYNLYLLLLMIFWETKTLIQF